MLGRLGGGMTLDEMADRMSHREFRQWMAFIRLETEQRLAEQRAAEQQRRG